MVAAIATPLSTDALRSRAALRAVAPTAIDADLSPRGEAWR